MKENGNLTQEILSICNAVLCQRTGTRQRGMNERNNHNILSLANQFLKGQSEKKIGVYFLKAFASFSLLLILLLRYVRLWMIHTCNSKMSTS